MRGLSIAISPVAVLDESMKAWFLVGVWLGMALTLGAADELTLEEPPAKKPVAPKTVAKPPAAPAQRLDKFLAVTHPRLLVTPERIATIRRQIQVPGSHHQLAYAALLERAAQDPAKVTGASDGRAGYRPVYASRELAFLSLVAPDAADRRRFAERAAQVLPTLGDSQNGGFKSRSLGHAMATFGLALTYDWAYNEWTDAERQKCEVLLEYFRQHWEKYRRVSEDPAKVSGYNFYGVLYGAEAMLLLATGAEKTSARFPVVVDVLRRHLTDMGGELGAHNEGIGYTEYPMGFSLPAALALAQHGENGPLAAANTHAFWKLNLFVQTFMTSFERKIVQYGVSHRSNSNEGFGTLLLALCPPPHLPHYVWFYDRHMGRLAKAEAAQRFDPGRGNGGFALLFYPTDVPGQDPTGVLPKAVADRDGYIFFRNRWQDENDIQVGLLNPVRRSGGWSQNEYLNLRLMAFDTRFFGGPGKEHAVENYTTLLVDGQHDAKRADSTFLPGKTESFAATPDGGYAIVDASDYYRALGVQRARRHLLVAFGEPKQGDAILSTLDDIAAAADHQYTWQANLGPEGQAAAATPAATEGDDEKPAAKPGLPTLDDPNPMPAAKPAGAEAAPAAKPEDDAIQSAAGEEAGRPYFLLTGRRGFVKGWVLHPLPATITTGDPLRATVTGKDTRLWVVLYAGQGEPPRAQIAGTGLESVLTVAGRRVRFDAGQERIRCER